jgi:hypothetical protein
MNTINENRELSKPIISTSYYVNKFIKKKKKKKKENL